MPASAKHKKYLYRYVVSVFHGLVSLLSVLSVTQEDTAVQRAKRALKAQLKLRGEAAGRAQELREDAARDEEGVAGGGAEAETEGEGGRQGELEALEGRIATASKVWVFRGVFAAFLRWFLGFWAVYCR